MTVTLADWHEQHTELERFERESLICHHLGLDRAALLVQPDRVIDADRLQRLDADGQRLRAGEPLAYILGEWSFWDFDLTVTPAVLIPRPETETLVEAALARYRPGDRILDMGTGSGAVAIALARAAATEVTALDASDAALEVARKNAQRAAATITFLQSDWFAAVTGLFDLIVANPPYVAAQDPHLAALVHEPENALVSGPDGLDDLTHIIQQAPAYLAAHGWLLVEHGYDQENAVAERFSEAGFEDVSLIRDLAGQPRVTVGRKPPGQVGRKPRSTVGRTAAEDQ